MAGMRPLTDQEIELFVVNLKRQRDRTLFVLGCKTGFRITELLSIQIKHVYQFSKIVDRLKIMRKDMKGKNESREVILNATAKLEIAKLLKELQEIYKTLDPEMYLFKSRKGENKAIERWQAWNIIKEIVREFELQGPIATHSMRKSFAERVYEIFKYDIIKTRDALGHSNVQTTEDYLTPLQSDIDEGILKV